MKTISIRELKAKWAAVEKRVQAGEEIEVCNRGKPVVRLVPVGPRVLSEWEDHLDTALPAKGRSVEQTVAADREGRW